MSGKNTELVANWFQQGWHEKNLNAVEKFYTEDCVLHDPYEIEICGHHGLKQFMTKIFNIFSDFKLDILDSVEEGEFVCTRMGLSGKQTGEFLGRPARQKNVVFSAMILWRIRDGRFCDIYQHWDVPGILGQIDNNLDPSIDLVPEKSLINDMPVNEQEIQANKAAVIEWMDGAWNHGSLDLASKLAADDLRFWDPTGPLVTSCEEFCGWAQSIDVAFPVEHRHLSIDWLIAQNNKTAYRITLTAKHLGEFNGIAPTERLINVGALIIAEHENGKIKQAWQIFDVFRIMWQLGQIIE